VLSDVAVACYITKAPYSDAMMGNSSMEQGTRGIKRSVAVDADGIPLGSIAAPSNHHDSPLLSETLDTVKTLALYQSWRTCISTAVTTRSSTASGWRNAA
jgi:hypothetical protein